MQNVIEKHPELITSENIDELIDTAINEKQYKTQIILMNYKAEKIGYSDPASKFRL